MGLIELQVTLGTAIPPDWALSATMTLGAGAHLAEIATDVETPHLVNDSSGPTNNLLPGIAAPLSAGREATSPSPVSVADTPTDHS